MDSYGVVLESFLGTCVELECSGLPVLSSTEPKRTVTCIYMSLMGALSASYAGLAKALESALSRACNWHLPVLLLLLVA